MKSACSILFTILFFLCGSLIAQLKNPVPFLNQPMSPPAVGPGGDGFTLTVNGAGFVSGSTVNWNGTTRTTVFVNRTKLRASITSSDVAEPATVEVSVTNPPPGGGSSNSRFFEVIPSHSELSFARTDFDAEVDPVSVVEGDFNDDGILDAAVVNSKCSSAGCAPEGTVSILLGTGQGSFQEPVNYPAGLGSIFVAKGDFNGDGKVDLAVAYHDCSLETVCSGSIAIFLGNGDGSFKSFVHYPTGNDPRYVAVADLNRDGKLDLVSANYSANSISILLGNGDGSFQTHTDFASGGGSPTSVAIEDFDRDNRLDLAVTNDCTTSTSCAKGNVTIFRGKGTGAFLFSESDPTQYAPHSIIAGDFDQDGIPDLALLDCFKASCSNSSISIFRGTTSGPFQAPLRINTSRQMWQLASGDFNGDGKLDLAASGSHIPCAGCAEDFADAILFLGKGDGTFQTNVQFQTGAHPGSIAIGDFNNDGKLDLITANTGTNSVSLLAQFYASNTLFKQERCATKYGRSVTFKAVVSGYRAGIIPTGTITFSSIKILGTVSLDIDGSATLSTNQLPTGSNGLTAAYSGDAIFAPSVRTDGLTCVIGRTFASITVSANPNPSVVNQQVTFTAFVTPNGSDGILGPTGSVRFSDRRSPNTVVVPLINGKASFTTPFTTSGNYYIKAFYLGDENYGTTGAFVHESVLK